MNLIFSWRDSKAGPQAICAVDPVDSRAHVLLAELLMDDAGVSRDTSIKSLKHGLGLIDSLKSTASASTVDWDRETWGASISEIETRIYSLFDESFGESLPTVVFRQVLDEWISFVEAEKSSTDERVVLELAVSSEWTAIDKSMSR